MIEVINRQRKLSLDCQRWEEFAAKALQTLPSRPAGATIVFISDRAMRDLNRQWRGKRGTTDVLSFRSAQSPLEEAEDSTLGDVVISAEQAARQAKANGLKFEEEVAQLILHGLLHLSGYDHETDNGEMSRLELRLRKKLAIDG